MDRTDAHDCGVDVAAYALGALDAHEAERFAEHLRDCAVCRDELQAFRAVVDVLPLTARTVTPRRSVRRNLMATVTAEQRTARTHPRRSLRWSVLLPSPRMGLGLAATLAAVLIGTGALLSGSGAPSTQVLSAQVIGQPGTARVRLTADRAELVVNHFAQPAAGRIYEVWLVRRGSRTPTPTDALFGVRNGRGDVDVPGSMRGVAAVLVTPEPAGGSQVPTHAPVVRARFS